MIGYIVIFAVGIFTLFCSAIFVMHLYDCWKEDEIYRIIHKKVKKWSEVDERRY